MLPTHPDFMGVGVGVGWVPVLFTYCSFHASGKVGGGACLGLMCLEEKTHPKHQEHALEGKMQSLVVLVRVLCVPVGNQMGMTLLGE